MIGKEVKIDRCERDEKEEKWAKADRVCDYEEGEAVERFDLKRLRKVTVIKNAQGMEIQEIIELMKIFGIPACNAAPPARSNMAGRGLKMADGVRKGAYP